ncbi:hypothetical protein [Flavobacterium sp. F52]|uniref:hypothetical protein n=1 Tax=Flavobacterium sp. F52 TaxID=1202532 RepID=UPI000272EED7|nr:hypothetical protein [Flavobacterium sp. F52]EJG03319.1 hypothetical protein FF52_01380 [Flavobacterium sp. F52]
MKRIIFLLVAVSANALFVSCSKEQDSKDSNSAKEKIEIPLTDYGFYHNEALDLYYKKYKGIDGKTTGLIIDEMLAELKIKYPEQFKNMDTNEVKLAFQNIDPKKFDMYSFWNSKKEELYASNKVSKRLGSLVDNIIEDDMNYNQCMVAIENFKKVNYLSKTTSTLTVNEQNELVVLENVLKSSNQYWTSKSNPTKKTNSQPGSKAIVADTMGALMFVYSGPMSIIAGGICSLFVNEAIPYEAVPYEEESINL